MDQWFLSDDLWLEFKDVLFSSETLAKASAEIDALGGLSWAAGPAAASWICPAALDGTPSNWPEEGAG